MNINKSLCYFCDKEASHFDVVVNDKTYIIADVCIAHLEMGLSS